MNTERPRSRSASKRWAFWAGSLTLAVSACGGEPGQVPPGSDPATLGEPEPLLYDQTILDDPSRTDDDRYRDVDMRPLDVYAFFGIEPGMVVADLGTALMYNAHILDHIVGPQGKVHAIVDWGPMLADWRSERTMPAYTQRKAAGALGNVELTGTLEELPADSLDALLIIRHYHDFGERDARVAQLPRFLRVLKPGGILGVMDAHTDKTDERDETVHRMNGASYHAVSGSPAPVHAKVGCSLPRPRRSANSSANRSPHARHIDRCTRPLPINAVQTTNVATPLAVPIGDLPTIDIWWFPPVYTIKGEQVDFVEIMQGVPKKDIAVGCSGGYVNLDNLGTVPAVNNMPASANVKMTRMTTGGKEKNFGSVKANTVPFPVAIWLAFKSRPIPKDTASIHFEITFSGTGTSLPRLGMDLNCGVTSINAVSRLTIEP